MPPSGSLQNGNARVGLGPQAVAAAADTGVPLDKVGERDLVLVQDLLAGLAIDEVEGLAVAHHAGLDGLGRGDAVPGVHGRRGVADDGHAGVSVRPEAVAAAAGRGVELDQLSDGDAVLAGHHLATLLRLHKVEGIAVVDHGCLSRRRGRDAVARLGGGGGVADDGHAGIRVAPKTAAGAADGGVELLELGDRDAVLGSDRLAVLALRHEVEGIAVVDDGGLERSGGGDAIGRLGGGGGWGMADDRHASVGIAPEGGAVTADGWVELEQLGDADAVLGSHCLAALATGNEVEGVAIVDNGLLQGAGGRDAVGWLGGGGRGGDARRRRLGRGGGCLGGRLHGRRAGAAGNRGLGRGRGDLGPVDLDTVGQTRLEVAAIGCHAGILWGCQLRHSSKGVGGQAYIFDELGLGDPVVVGGHGAGLAALVHIRPVAAGNAGTGVRGEDGLGSGKGPLRGQETEKEGRCRAGRHGGN